MRQQILQEEGAVFGFAQGANGICQVLELIEKNAIKLFGQQAVKGNAMVIE